MPIKIAYATTSGIRLPLWIAEEAKLYEKYKLDAKLINIPSGNTAIRALVSGEVDIVSDSGSASIVAIDTDGGGEKSARLVARVFHGGEQAIALGKKNKALVQKVIGKQMKVTDRKRLDVIYDASLGRMPSKPYPREEAVALELESVAFTDPLFKNKKVSEFMDGSIIAELDRKGFFAQLQ